jgi:hypothetical protein
VSKPLLPERVPPLDQRLRQILLSLPPGRRATVATLTGWLSITEDPADVQQALALLRAQHLATVEIEHRKGSRPTPWWGP